MLRHISFTHQGNAGGKKWVPEGKLCFPAMRPLEMMLHKQTLSDVMQGECFMKTEPEDHHNK